MGEGGVDVENFRLSAKINYGDSKKILNIDICGRH